MSPEQHDDAVTVRRLPTIRDVADRAGVSPGLVSRLLNDDPTLTVRPGTRELVMRAVDELGYVPRSAAAALRRNRVDALALVLDRVTNPVFADVVHGAERAATELGLGLLLLDAEEVARDATFLTGIVRSRRVDGLLLQGGFGPGASVLEGLAVEIPSVILNSSGTPAASGVRLEDDEAARLAAQHLLDLGHTRVAYVAGLPGTPNSLRRAGVDAALAGARLGPARVLDAGWQAADGHRAISTSDARGADAPTAYVAGTAVVALGVLAALAEAGLRVPDDVSVVGIHDPWFAPYGAPPLTTVALPLLELGRASVHQLAEHLASGRPDDVVLTDPAPRLVVRGSTGPARS